MQTTLLMLLAGLFSACASLAGQNPAEPPLRLSCDALYLAQGMEGGRFVRSWDMVLGLEIQETGEWKIAWCEEDKARVTVEDSFGNRTADVACCYSCMNVDDVGPMSLSSRNWMPAVGSQWVSVKGEVPFAVSRQDAVSEPVTVKLVKGFSVPVALKGAGLAGGDGKPADVKATLKVKAYVDAGEKGKKRVTFELVADRNLGFREFEMQTTNGQPVIVKCQGGRNSVNVGSCSWYRALQMDEEPEGEVRVMVRYAGEPQRSMAMVDSRASLSGFGGAAGEKAQPGANGKAGAGEIGETSAAVAVQPGSGKASAVKAELHGLRVYDDTMPGNDGQPESRPKLFFDMRFEAKGGVGFGGHAIPGEQSLEVTDSKGRVLKPAVFDLNGYGLYKGMNKGVSYTVVRGTGPELASPGAEWVRLKGTLRVPMSGTKVSPVYELPLVKGAERHVSVPGMDESRGDDDDVAVAGDAPACKLWLREVARDDGGDVQVEVSMQVEDVTVDFDGFELVDDKGIRLDVNYVGGRYAITDSRRERSEIFMIRKAADMKRLRFKLKYKVEMEMAPVPVDITVGLGGPVSENKARATKEA